MDILDEYTKHDLIAGNYYAEKLKLEEINKNVKHFQTLIDVCNKKLSSFNEFLSSSVNHINYEFYVDKVISENISLIQIKFNLQKEIKNKEEKEDEVNNLYKIVLQNMEKQKEMKKKFLFI